MSQIKMDSEDIAEIRNSLTAISLSAETMEFEYPLKAIEKRDVIMRQVIKIDRLLSDVKSLRK